MNSIDIKNWKEFKVSDFFDIHPTKNHGLTNSHLLSENGDNPVVVNSAINNGIGGFTSYDTTEEKGIITFSDTTTSEAAFYQPNDFVGYSHIQGMYPKEKYKEKWTENCMLFFLTIFKKKAADKNYNYVHKFTRKDASNMRIKLPVSSSQNEPDWEYMEEFINKVKEEVSGNISIYKKIL